MKKRVGSNLYLGKWFIWIDFLNKKKVIWIKIEVRQWYSEMSLASENMLKGDKRKIKLFHVSEKCRKMFIKTMFILLNTSFAPFKWRFVWSSEAYHFIFQFDGIWHATWYAAYLIVKVQRILWPYIKEVKDSFDFFT